MNFFIVSGSAGHAGPISVTQSRISTNGGSIVAIAGISGTSYDGSILTGSITVNDTTLKTHGGDNRPGGPQRRRLRHRRRQWRHEWPAQSRGYHRQHLRLRGRQLRDGILIQNSALDAYAGASEGSIVLQGMSANVNGSGTDGLVAGVTSPAPTSSPTGRALSPSPAMGTCRLTLTPGPTTTAWPSWVSTPVRTAATRAPPPRWSAGRATALTMSSPASRSPRARGATACSEGRRRRRDGERHAAGDRRRREQLEYGPPVHQQQYGDSSLNPSLAAYGNEGTATLVVATDSDRLQHAQQRSFGVRGAQQRRHPNLVVEGYHAGTSIAFGNGAAADLTAAGVTGPVLSVSDSNFSGFTGVTVGSGDTTGLVAGRQKRRPGGGGELHTVYGGSVLIGSNISQGNPDAVITLQANTGSITDAGGFTVGGATTHGRPLVTAFQRRHHRHRGGPRRPRGRHRPERHGRRRERLPDRAFRLRPRVHLGGARLERGRQSRPPPPRVISRAPTS